MAVLPRFLRNAVGFSSARRAARSVLEASVQRDRTRAPAGGRDGAQVIVVMADPPSAAATADGTACGFYGSAVAELLRALTEFDGALYHVRCRSRGDAACEWRSGNPDEA
jgi:hypothetical protein